MARSEAPALAKAVGNSYPLRLPPPRQSSTLHAQVPANSPPVWEAANRGSLSILCGVGGEKLYWTTYSRRFTAVRIGLLAVVCLLGLLLTCLGGWLRHAGAPQARNE